ANRFLYVLVRRSKEMPFGGNLSDSEVLHLGDQLKTSVERAKLTGHITMTDAAKTLWASVYGSLSAAQPGLLGAVTSRAESQVVRLALIYPPLDGAGEIDKPHLTAALALWEYCEASAAFIFGSSLITFGVAVKRRSRFPACVAPKSLWQPTRRRSRTNPTHLA